MPLTATISGDGKRIYLNAPAARLWLHEKAEYVHLLWDSHKQTVGMRLAVKSDEDAFKIVLGTRRNHASLSCNAQAFLRYIKATHLAGKTFKAAWSAKHRILSFRLDQEVARPYLRGQSGKQTTVNDPETMEAVTAKAEAR